MKKGLPAIADDPFVADLHKTLILAHTAVLQDSETAEGNYAMSGKMYKDAAAGLKKLNEQLVSMLAIESEDQGANSMLVMLRETAHTLGMSMEHYSEIYAQRGNLIMEFLNSQIQPPADPIGHKSPMKILSAAEKNDIDASSFEENQLLLKPSPELLPLNPPMEKSLRPYWFMRTLIQAMEQGVYLTPELYICPELWLQEGIQVESQLEKIGCLRFMYRDVLDKISRLSKKHPDKFLRDITQMAQDLEIIQNNFANTIECIPATKHNVVEIREKKLTAQRKNLIQEKSQKYANEFSERNFKSVKEYSEALKFVMIRAQEFETWVIDPSLKDANLQYVQRINSFFEKCFCVWIMQDIITLAVYYYRRQQTKLFRSFASVVNS